MDVVYTIPERLLIELGITCIGNESTTIEFKHKFYTYKLRKQTNGIFSVIVRNTKTYDLVDSTKLIDYEGLLDYIELIKQPKIDKWDGIFDDE